MAEEKAGYPVIVKINLPPEQQYHSGHSLIVQGNTVAEVSERLQALVPGAQPGVGDTIIRRFTEFALLGAVKTELKAEQSGPVEPATETPEGEELASKALKNLVVKRTGKDLAQLEGITKTAAEALLEKEEK